MSTDVSDQRMQGRGNQPPNGPNKDQLSEHEDFSSWRSQSIQQNAYVSAPSVGPSSDPYLTGYYGSSIPYQLDHGAWSSGSGGAPAEVPFLGGYPQQHHHHQQQQQQQQHQHHDAYGIDVFGQSNGGFGNFGGYDYASAWDRKAAHYDEYYARADYSPRQQQQQQQVDDQLKQVEQGVHSMSMAEQKLQQQQQHEQVQQPKKLTWASIASQPAKPQFITKKKSMVPPPMVTPRTPSLDIGTWENKNGAPVTQAPPPLAIDSMTKTEAKPAAPSVVVPPKAAVQQQQHHHHQQAAPPTKAASGVYQRDEPAILPPRPSRPSPPPLQAAPIRDTVAVSPPKAVAPALPAAAVESAPSPTGPSAAVPVLDELVSKHNYNPKEFDLSAKNARFFVIKSYSEDDIHRSIKYEIWCSTEHGNKRLDAAFRERDGNGPVYLFFSVNGSGHFCGMAEMISAVDMSSTLSVWAQDKWRGQFSVKWIYVKDVPNAALRHIRLENNENKPVTNSRDTQEVPPDKGRMVLKILHTYRHATSIFDDFSHYEKRQAEEDQRKTVTSVSPVLQQQADYDDHHQQQQQQHVRGPPSHYDREQQQQQQQQRYSNEPRDYRGPPRDRPAYDHRERDGYMRDRRDDRPMRDRDRYAEPRDFRARNDRSDYDHRERDGYMRDRDPRRDGGRDRDGYNRAPDRGRDSAGYQRTGDGFGRRPRN